LSKIEFLSHKFDSRYARKPIKGSKDSDDSLVSTKNLKEKMSHWVGAQGQVKLAKRAKTCPYCDVTHKKQNPKQKNII